jgi:hypothetical protein
MLLSLMQMYEDQMSHLYNWAIHEHLILCSDVATIVGLSLPPFISFCGVGITGQKKLKRGGGGIEKLARGIGRATQVTLKSDVDSPGNISVLVRPPPWRSKPIV